MLELRRVTSPAAADIDPYLLRFVESLIEPLPPGPNKARMDEVERPLASTRLCWIGGTGDADTFYYRIQSPVTMIEFDHHAGVFLTNELPHDAHPHTGEAHTHTHDGHTHTHKGGMTNDGSSSDSCAFLCSVQAGFISGQNVQLDGGSYAGLI